MWLRCTTRLPISMRYGVEILHVGPCMRADLQNAKQTCRTPEYSVRGSIVHPTIGQFANIPSDRQDLLQGRYMIPPVPPTSPPRPRDATRIPGACDFGRKHRYRLIHSHVLICAREIVHPTDYLGSAQYTYGGEHPRVYI
jgi:hypothetical protein